MFQFLFKYPPSTFSSGQLVLLGPWPTWILWTAMGASAAGLAWVVASRLPRLPSGARNWPSLVAIWLLESLMACVLLILLWQPALSVTELKPQQNIIAVMVDDSRSMSVVEDGSTRLARAVKALETDALPGIGQKFQVRFYRLDSHLTRIADLNGLQAAAPATHIGDSLKQFAEESADLPIGAVILLSDGSDNSGGINLETIAALRNRHIPVHTVGVGREQAAHDIEIDDALVAPRTLADSRLGAVVRFHQRGYAGRKARLTVRDGTTVLSAREITLEADGVVQSETLLFTVGAAGGKALQYAMDKLPDEENVANNAVTRLVNVESDKRRVLYIEGEPRWEYKFIRRAEDDDRLVQLVPMLRTTENKIYRQNIENPKELAEGFPRNAKELFAYQALIIGSVEATYFTPVQRELIREFVDRRGGGLLLLGGRFSLADGGWGVSNLADLLPVVLPDAKNTFHVEPATVELAPAGVDSYITRLVDDPVANAERWKKLPYLMDYQEPGVPKPGASVLADMQVQGRKMPMLVTESFGRGRTAVLATSGTWRWGMLQPSGNPTHSLFWQQLLRWLVTDSPGHVAASVSNQMLFDDGRIALTADVRGEDYQPVVDARVEAHVIGPGGLAANIELTPVPDMPGSFQADWTAERSGSYLTEVIARRGAEPIGRDVLTFQRMDAVAENFHMEQNRDLLVKLAAQTGGRYWRPEDVSRLPDEIAFSEAGVTARTTKELWNMPAVFFLIVLLRAAEWLLRRKWGNL